MEARDIFFLCIALGKGQRQLPSHLMTTDMYYSIYLSLVSKID